MYACQRYTIGYCVNNDERLGSANDQSDPWSGASPFATTRSPIYATPFSSSSRKYWSIALQSYESGHIDFPSVSCIASGRAPCPQAWRHLRTRLPAVSFKLFAHVFLSLYESCAMAMRLVRGPAATHPRACPSSPLPPRSGSTHAGGLYKVKGAGGRCPPVRAAGTSSFPSPPYGCIRLSSRCAAAAAAADARPGWPGQPPHGYRTRQATGSYN